MNSTALQNALDERDLDALVERWDTFSARTRQYNGFMSIRWRVREVAPCVQGFFGILYLISNKKERTGRWYITQIMR